MNRNRYVSVAASWFFFCCCLLLLYPKEYRVWNGNGIISTPESMKYGASKRTNRRINQPTNELNPKTNEWNETYRQTNECALSLHIYSCMYGLVWFGLGLEFEPVCSWCEHECEPCRYANGFSVSALKKWKIYVYAIKRIKNDGTKNFGSFASTLFVMCVCVLFRFDGSGSRYYCCCFFRQFSPFSTHKKIAFCLVSFVSSFNWGSFYMVLVMLLLLLLLLWLFYHRLVCVFFSLISFHFGFFFLLYFIHKSVYISACLAIKLFNGELFSWLVDANITFIRLLRSIYALTFVKKKQKNII